MHVEELDQTTAARRPVESRERCEELPEDCRDDECEGGHCRIAFKTNRLLVETFPLFNLVTLLAFDTLDFCDEVVDPFSLLPSSMSYLSIPPSSSSARLHSATEDFCIFFLRLMKLKAYTFPVNE